MPDEPNSMHIYQKTMIRSKCGILLHGVDNVFRPDFLFVDLRDVFFSDLRSGGGGTKKINK